MLNTGLESKLYTATKGNRRYTGMIPTGIEDFLIDFETAAGIAAIITPILVLLTYKWNSMDSIRDRESILRERINKVKATAGGFTIQVTGVRMQKSNWLIYKLKKWFLFRLSGYTRLEVFILQQQMPQNELWNNPLFTKFCEAHGFDAEHIATSTGNTDSTGVIFRLHTLDLQVVEDFVKLLPEYLRVMAEQGLLQSVRPGQVEDLEEFEELFAELET